ncbi:ABC transporter ATP-binding protein/permease [Acetobacter pasteurianus]|uniref:ABC transporter ATP-binding protein/permease n=1 Tax=Acetobacter pasteurianus TaxID=438 RepID=UPI000F575744|nr:SbmA/BacA-like family transporter [Acetobacter pasteurianus]
MVYGSSTFPRLLAISWQRFVLRTDKPSSSHSLSDWKILFPFWVSAEKWKAWGLLGLIIGLSLLYVRTAVWFGIWDQKFFDAFFAFHVGQALGLLPVYIAACAFSAGIYVLQTYLTQILSMRWRLWNTKVYLQHYLQNTTYYRLEHDAAQADNPDQRIADDLAQMTTLVLKLGLDAIQAVMTLLSFSIVLWEIGGALSVPLWGHIYHIPGYLFFGTVIVSVSVSFVIEKAGGPLINADYQQQHYDADLRASLLDLRRNSEQVAFYKGEDAEHLRFSTHLAHIARNWRKVVHYTWRANFVGTFYNQTASIILWVLLVPKIMVHALTFGAYARINAAFMQVRRSLQWFIDNYTDLAGLRSTLQRLAEFERIIQQKPIQGIVCKPTNQNTVSIHNLVLNLPSGQTLLDFGSLTFQAGERWAIYGASGSGKSTFLRSLAGLWPYGSGEVCLNSAKAMFVPQQSYVPSGSLRQALSYPLLPEQHDLHAYEEALHAANLDGYVSRLDEEQVWGNILSGGEQQRLALARVFLFQPSILFLDEATSALDETNERCLYDALLTLLPNCTIISVTHRKALQDYHQKQIVLQNGKAFF